MPRPSVALSVSTTTTIITITAMSLPTNTARLALHRHCLALSSLPHRITTTTTTNTTTTHHLQCRSVLDTKASRPRPGPLQTNNPSADAGSRPAAPRADGPTRSFNKDGTAPKGTYMCVPSPATRPPLPQPRLTIPPSRSWAAVFTAVFGGIYFTFLTKPADVVAQTTGLGGAKAQAREQREGR